MYSQEELLAMPISSIVDGWQIDKGRTLYLWVKIVKDDGVLLTPVLITRQEWNRVGGKVI